MTEFTKRIAVGTDDCCSYSTGTFLVNAAFFGKTSVSVAGGFRFSNITIPAGSTIDSAKITFRAIYDRTTTTCNVTIKGIDEDNFDGFSNSAGDKPHDYASVTTESVDWSSIAGWTTDTDYDTPDFKDVIQEIIDRGGWSSGNALGVVLRDNGSSANANRYPYDYNDSSTYAALLTINYTEGAGDTFIPKVMII